MGVSTLSRALLSARHFPASGSAMRRSSSPRRRAVSSAISAVRSVESLSARIAVSGPP
jgi:hypothetical protein